MTIENDNLLLRSYGILESKINGSGYSVRLAVDFEDIREEIEEAGKEVSPHFWPMYFDYNRDNGFCMVLEHEGEGVAYICYQRIDLGGMNFWEKHQQRIRQCFGRDEEAVLDPNWKCRPMEKLTGVMAYSGDALTRERWRSTKSILYLEKICYLSQLFAMLVWKDVEWIGGLARGHDVRRGLAARYGAKNMDPGAELWIEPPKKSNGKPARENGYWFLSSHRDDVLFRAECIERGLLFGSIEPQVDKQDQVAK